MAQGVGICGDEKSPQLTSLKIVSILLLLNRLNLHIAHMLRLSTKSLLLVLFSTTISSLSAQQNQTKPKGRDAIREESTYLGFEYLVNQPATRNGFVMNHTMHGINAEFLGIMTLGNLTGFGYLPDSGAYSRAKMMYIDFHGSFPLFKTRWFNIRPEIGFRMVRNSMNYYYTDNEMDANGLGAGLSAGASVHVGPALVKFKYMADGLVNLGGNSFKGLNHYGSVTVGLNPWNLFMNPKNFTFTGIRKYVTDYQKVQTGERVEFKKDGDKEYKVTTKGYRETWNETYGPQDFSCKDVQPYWWIGPRLVSNFSRFEKDKLLAATGLNLGFRYGSLYMNAFYEQGDVSFNEPFKRNYDFQSAYQGKIGRMDGVFSNSNRYGLQLGVELVTWFQKKDYIYEYSRLRSVTSHFALIPIFTYGKAKFGDIRFYESQGAANVDAFVGGKPTAENDIRLTPKEMDLYGLGLQIGIGAVALNIEKSYYRANDAFWKLPSTWLATLNFNVPVARIVRAVGAKSKFKQASKK